MITVRRLRMMTTRVTTTSFRVGSLVSLVQRLELDVHPDSSLCASNERNYG
jgi:hypothetical protein